MQRIADIYAYIVETDRGEGVLKDEDDLPFMEFSLERLLRFEDVALARAMAMHVQLKIVRFGRVEQHQGAAR